MCYAEVLKYSYLEKDLEILPNGDQTEIGEKGINLSGGQKARVALARAIYSNSDIYFIDDTLSSVDVHVGNYIMQEYFLKYLHGKTRILITHNWDYLKCVDEIIIMEGGSIIERGSYSQIKESKLYQDIIESLKADFGANSEEKEARNPSSNGNTSNRGALLIKRADENEKSWSLNDGNSLKKEEVDPVIQKLTLKEDRESGAIHFGVYKEYLDFNGGCVYFSLILFGN